MSLFNKIGLLLLLIFAGTGTFWLGKQTFDKVDNSQKTAQIGDSLSDRFYPVTEKYTAPSIPTRLSNDDAISAILSPDGKEVYYYSPLRGEIRKIKLDNNLPATSVLVAKIEVGAQDLSWSHDRKSVIAQYTRGPVYYNLAQNTSLRYGSDVLRPKFAGNNNLIVYERYDAAKHSGSINISNPLLEGEKELLQTRSDKWQMFWDGGRYVTLYTLVSGSRTLYDVFSLDTETKRLIKDFERIDNLDMNRSDDGKYSLISERIDNKQSLKIMTMSSGRYGSLNIKTKASKCGWSNGNLALYCAAQESDGKESIARIDLQTREIKDVYLPENNLRTDFDNILVGNLEGYLVMRNALDGKLYYFTPNL